MKRFFLLILLIISISTLCSCSHIEDKNGIEDYSLTTISEQDILDNKYSQIKTNSIMNSSNNKITFTVKKFSGEELIKTFNLSNKTMTFTSNIKLYSGNLRIVLCSNDRILKDFSINGDDSFTLSNYTGKIRLICAGESANFELIINC